MTALTCIHDGVTVILKGEGNGIDSRIVARHAFASATRTSAYNAKSASMNLNSRCYSDLSALLAKPDQEADTKRASMVSAASGRQLPDVLQRPEFKPYAHIHDMGRGHKNSPRPRGILTWKELYSCQKYGLCESITVNATRLYHQYAPALDFKRMVFEQAVDVVINEKDRQFLTTHPLQLHWGLTSGAGLSTCNSKTNKSLTQTVDPQQTFAATNGEHRGKADLLHKQQYATPCYCQKDARITGKSQRFSMRKAHVIEGLRGMSGIKSTSELNGGRS